MQYYWLATIVKLFTLDSKMAGRRQDWVYAELLNFWSDTSNNMERWSPARRSSFARLIAVGVLYTRQQRRAKTTKSFWVQRPNLERKSQGGMNVLNSYRLVSYY